MEFALGIFMFILVSFAIIQIAWGLIKFTWENALLIFCILIMFYMVI